MKKIARLLLLSGVLFFGLGYSAQAQYFDFTVCNHSTVTTISEIQLFVEGGGRYRQYYVEDRKPNQSYTEVVDLNADYEGRFDYQVTLLYKINNRYFSQDFFISISHEEGGSIGFELDREGLFQADYRDYTDSEYDYFWLRPGYYD